PLEEVRGRLLRPCLTPSWRMIDARCYCRRLSREGSVEFLGTGAVPGHPDIETPLNLEVLNMTEVLRKLVTIVDKGRNNDSVRAIRRSEFGLLLTTEHLTKLLCAPRTSEVVARPECNKDTRPT